MQGLQYDEYVADNNGDDGYRENVHLLVSEVIGQSAADSWRHVVPDRIRRFVHRRSLQKQGYETCKNQDRNPIVYRIHSVAPNSPRYQLASCSSFVPNDYAVARHGFALSSNCGRR